MKISPLEAWLDRKKTLDSFTELLKNPPNNEWGASLGLDIVMPIHESIDLEAESLTDSWNKIHSYVKEALSLIDSDSPGLLDSEEALMIREELGIPPTLCYPLYLITVGNKSSEKIVYIGKTSSKKNRFRGGHLAFTKLHHPKYNRLKKRLYLGAIVLLDDKDYQPLEWVKPLTKANIILESIEAQLIFDFKPELNTQHVNSNNATWKTSIHIQNFTKITSFLHDEFCYPQD